ncbi:MAG: sarcosine oxidase subunit gamma [Saprospiraceae bacterium]|jgi:sarcosine oxidase subunit gamma
MTNQTTIQTPLAAKEPVELAGTRLSEMPLCGKITLRGNSDNKAFVAAIKKATGLALPIEANTFNQKGSSMLSWTGPNEWMLHCEIDACLTMVDKLRTALADQHAAIVDVSDYYTMVELSGPLAKKVIANGSPFDTHHTQFTTGQCTQTRFGHAGILMNQMDDNPTYHIQIRWSYADYLFGYMHDALRNHAAEAS